MDFPFKPDIHDVIYVENEYNPIVNEYIENHYDELQEKFRQKNVNFIYMPRLRGNLVKNEELRYMFPYVTKDASFVYGDLPIESIIKQHAIEGEIIEPALLHRIELPDDCLNYYLTYRSLSPNSKVSLSDRFEWYIQHLSFQ